MAGDTNPTGAFFSGLDLGVTSLTFDGVTYTDVNRLNSPSSVAVGFEGPGIAAPSMVGSTAVLSVPFSGNGTLFLVPDPAAPAMAHTLEGSGVASLNLRRVGTEDLWQFDGVSYEIGEAAAPIPEPSTLMLLAAGLGAAAGIARKKSR